MVKFNAGYSLIFHPDDKKSLCFFILKANMLQRSNYLFFRMNLILLIKGINLKQCYYRNAEGTNVHNS